MKTYRFRNAAVALLVLLVGTASAFAAGVPETRKTGPVHNEYAGPIAKYVFVFIGDGMGLPQVSGTEILAGAMKYSSPNAPRTLTFTQFPAQGITTTHDATSFIPDSASTGTSIASGHKTLSGVVGMDTTKTRSYTSIAQQAKAKGMKVGVVSSVSIEHATPAAFYASVPSRGMMYEIALQLVDSGFDYFGGGSVTDPDGKRSKMENKPGNVFDLARRNGYTVTTSREEFNRLRPGAGKVWAVTEKPADAMAMLYELDRPADTLSLADFTQKGIELLDNPNGFFLVVEGGKIDWACHANDALSAIRDVQAFDEAVRRAVAFAQRRPDETLIVVTGDHECGGMTIGFAGTGYNSNTTLLLNQKISYVAFDAELAAFKKQYPRASAEQVFPLINEHFGFAAADGGRGMDLSDYEKQLLTAAFAETMKDPKARTGGEQAKILYGGYEPLTVTLTHILNNKAGIGWTSYSHTGIPVPTYAMGLGQDLFDGYYDNTDIYRKLAAVMGVENLAD